MSRSVTTVLSLAGLWILAVVLTIVAMTSFIIPEERGDTFYCVVSFICFAEFIVFGYLAYLITIPHTVKRPSQAMRLQIMTLIFVWFIAVIITGVIAVRPSLADSFYSDKILVFHLIMTFLLMFSAYFLQRSDVAVQEDQEGPQRERIQLQSYSAKLQMCMNTIQSLGDQNDEYLVELQSLTKTLDTLKTQLLSVSPKAKREQARIVDVPTTDRIRQQVEDLLSTVDRLKGCEPEQMQEEIKNIDKAAVSIVSDLRQREEMLSY